MGDFESDASQIVVRLVAYTTAQGNRNVRTQYFLRLGAMTGGGMQTSLRAAGNGWQPVLDLLKQPVGLCDWINHSISKNLVVLRRGQQASLVVGDWKS